MGLGRPYTVPNSLLPFPQLLAVAIQVVGDTVHYARIAVNADLYQDTVSALVLAGWV